MSRAPKLYTRNVHVEHRVPSSPPSGLQRSTIQADVFLFLLPISAQQTRQALSNVLRLASKESTAINANGYALPSKRSPGRNASKNPRPTATISMRRWANRGTSNFRFNPPKPRCQRRHVLPLGVSLQIPSIPVPHGGSRAASKDHSLSSLTMERKDLPRGSTLPW